MKSLVCYILVVFFADCQSQGPTKRLLPLGYPCGLVQTISSPVEDCPVLEEPCVESFPYRSINGSCNNLLSPLTGAVRSTFTRLTSPRHYETPGPDMVFKVKAADGSLRSLPHARSIVRAVHSGPDDEDPHWTLMVMQLGQFLDHDLTLTAESSLCSNDPCSPSIEETSCCEYFLDPGKFDNTRPASCLPIPIPDGDPFFNPTNGPDPPRCLDFMVSQRTRCDGQPEVFNEVSHFCDGSNIYGSEEALALDVKGSFGGLARMVDGRLPHLVSKCRHAAVNIPFLGGDVRVNEHPYLMAMHTLWIMEHNRFATRLKFLFPHKSDKDIFLETRRHVVAEYVNIAYMELVVALVGQQAAKKAGLDLLQDSLYDPKVDPRISVEFSTAAFRFGHSTVKDLLRVVRLDGGDEEVHRLDESFFNTTLINGDSLYVKRMLHSLAWDPLNKVDGSVVDALRNGLFKSDNSRFGNDLPSRNIHRGRDHQIGSYGDFRKFCKLSPLPKVFTDEENRPRELSLSSWRALASVYTLPEDIELFPGGMLEQPGEGMLGPTFACIVMEQFHRLRVADRFFFTHTNVHKNVRMCPDSVVVIRRRTLRDVICDNVPGGLLQMDVFRPVSDRNPMLPCEVSKTFEPDVLCLFGEDRSHQTLMAEKQHQESLEEPHVAVLAGGYDGIRLLKSVETYSVNGRCNLQLAPLPIPLYGFLLLYHRQRLLACGGPIWKDCLEYVPSPNPGQPDSWRILPSMKMKRFRWLASAAATPQGVILVTGGVGEEKTGEHLDAVSDGWKEGPSGFKVARSRHCGVVLERDQLFLLGGYSQGNLTELYSPTFENWTASSQNFWADRHSCLALPNNKMLITGADVSAWIHSVADGQTQVLPPTFVTRSYGCVLKVNKDILVLGGDGHSTMVEILKPDYGTLSPAEEPLMRPRSRFGCVSVPASLFRNLACYP